MNKNATPLILIVLSLGIYFTYIRAKIDEVKTVQVVNAEYQKAISDSKTLTDERDSVLATYNKIDPLDRERLEKMIPDNEDNVRLIIDLNAIASRHGLSIKNVKTAIPKNTTTPANGDKAPQGIILPGTYNTVTLSFDTIASYSNFLNFLKDLQASLRITEVSKVSLKASDTGNYDYNVEIKTFWLKE